MDGAYFGRSFPHVLLEFFPDIAPASSSSEKYIPRIFGFKIANKSDRPTSQIAYPPKQKRK
jgi:casein kinase II subunit beta